MKNRIKATFKGEDGSLGYSTGYTHLLILEQYGWLESQIRGYPVSIRLLNGKGFCPYSSMEAFKSNWEYIQIV